MNVAGPDRSRLARRCMSKTLYVVVRAREKILRRGQHPGVEEQELNVTR